jgi:hypothetical protein
MAAICRLLTAIGGITTLKGSKLYKVNTTTYFLFSFRVALTANAFRYATVEAL